MGLPIGAKVDHSESDGTESNGSGSESEAYSTAVARYHHLVFPIARLQPYRRYVSTWTREGVHGKMTSEIMPCVQLLPIVNIYQTVAIISGANKLNKVEYLIQM